MKEPTVEKSETIPDEQKYESNSEGPITTSWSEHELDQGQSNNDSGDVEDAEEATEPDGVVQTNQESSKDTQVTDLSTKGSLDESNDPYYLQRTAVTALSQLRSSDPTMASTDPTSKITSEKESKPHSLPKFDLGSAIPKERFEESTRYNSGVDEPERGKVGSLIERFNNQVKNKSKQGSLKSSNETEELVSGILKELLPHPSKEAKQYSGHLKRRSRKPGPLSSLEGSEAQAHRFSIGNFLEPSSGSRCIPSDAHFTKSEVVKRYVGSRWILEAKGVQLLVSQVPLEEGIQEVRILGNIVYVDRDLVLNGSSIIVVAECLVVCDEHTWDVSGRDCSDIATSPAETADDGNGLDGAPGGEGGQGGTILILAELTESAEKLTLLANGGKGGVGQDGGQGLDGRNGSSISDEEFKLKYPPCARFLHHSRVHNIIKTLKNLEEELTKITVFWHSKHPEASICVDSPSKEIELYKPFIPNLYLRGITKAGSEVHFSASPGNVESNAYLLYKGSLGSPGGRGGAGGKGGEGGAPGFILAPYPGVKQVAEPGSSGDNGRPGHDGRFGQNGRDIAYLDFYVSYFMTESWPQYRYGDSNNQLTFQYFEDVKKHVWCPYRHRLGMKSQYVDITPIRIWHRKEITHQCEEDVSLGDERVKQKELLTENTVADKTELKEGYPATFTRQLSLRSHQALNTEIFHLKQVEQRLHAPFYNAEITLGELGHIDDWFRLKTVPMNKTELNGYFSHYENFLVKHSEIESAKVNEIRKIIVEKFRLSILEEIAAQEVSTDMPKNLEVMAYEAANYLIEAEGAYLNIGLETTSKKLSIGPGVRDIDPQVVHFLENLNIFLGNTKENNFDVMEKLLNLVKKKRIMSDSRIMWENLEGANLNKIKCLEIIRQLLSLDINLRIYSRNDQNKLILKCNLNATSKRAVHVVQTSHKLKLMTLQRSLFQLKKEREIKSEALLCILEETDSLQTKKDVEKYLVDWKKKKIPRHFQKNKSSQIVHTELLNYIKNLTSSFSNAHEAKDVEKSLGLIDRRIVKSIYRRFEFEGRHVSYEELRNCLNFALKNPQEYGICTWIFTAYPQNAWVGEFLILQLENYLKTPLGAKLPHMRELIRKIDNTRLMLFEIKLGQQTLSSRVHLETLENVLHLLSEIPENDLGLEELTFDAWIYALKGKYWSSRLSKLACWSDEQLERASYFLLSLENFAGTNVIENFVDILAQKRSDLSKDDLKEEFVDFLFHLTTIDWCISDQQLAFFSTRSLGEFMSHVMDASSTGGEKSVDRVLELISLNASTSTGIKTALSQINSISSEIVSSYTEDNIKEWAEKVKCSGVAPDFEMTLAVVDQAVYLKRGFRLRATQKLSALLMLKNERKTLAQVKTGEGKSLIVTAVAITKSLCNECVDIVTSSPVLAKRDASSNCDIYNLFGIRASDNCSENIEERTTVYSTCHIVYGELSNFQRDYLLDKFYGKKILGNRLLTNVIVDEVDSMLLDLANSTLYISHEIAGLDKLESVYTYIWQLVTWSGYKNPHLINHQAIKEAVLYDLYGIITKKDIAKLKSSIKYEDAIVIWQVLVEANVLDETGILLRESVDAKQLKNILPDWAQGCKHSLAFLIKQCSLRKKNISLPNYLKPFVKSHLDIWVENAITALLKVERGDYIVDIDRSRSGSDKNPNIIILDTYTGTDQSNSQWEEALHQFLQLKHGCKLTTQSLKAVFMSNVTFFKMYTNMYGLTGTLGSTRERDLLKEIYNVDFLTIPTAKMRRFVEKKPTFCSDDEEWTRKIIEEVDYIISNNRSILIICETVGDVEMITKSFRERKISKFYTYTRDYEAFDIARGERKLDEGKIIIATNLAGRGTDIRLTETLKEAGGLHVCLSFLPDNERIEQQAFGRAARNGDQGSGRLIFKGLKRSYMASRKKKDMEELLKISGTKTHYEKRSCIEENCFRAFQKHFVHLSKVLDTRKIDVEIKATLLQSILDKWAFWLDRHRDLITRGTEEDRLNLDIYLDSFISDTKDMTTSNDYYQYMLESPILAVKVAKLLIPSKPSKAIEIFDVIIKMEPEFSGAAHYYKSYALAKTVSWKNPPKNIVKQIKFELREAERLFDEHKKCAMTAAVTISSIKQKNSQSIVQIRAYEEQQLLMSEIYGFFSDSISNIIGRPVNSQSFRGIKEGAEPSEIVFNKLVKDGHIKPLRLKKTIPDDALRKISNDYGISKSHLKRFLTNFQEKDLDTKEFKIKVEKGILLPSREQFWKSLKGSVLTNETKFVFVNSFKLKGIDPKILEMIESKLEHKLLTSVSLKCTDPNEIFFNAECLAIEKIQGKIFYKEDFIKEISEETYHMLKEIRVVKSNKKATINLGEMETAKFPCFDSLTLEDFLKVDIHESEARGLLKELVGQGYLEENRGIYKLGKVCEFRLTGSPVYEDLVRRLISHRFCYRLALREVKKRLLAKEKPLCIPLSVKPHYSFLADLTAAGIVKPVSVSKTYKNVRRSYSQILEKSSGLLNTLEAPRWQLVPLQVSCEEFQCTEEFKIMSLNALDKLICLEDKWTKKMIAKTASTFFLGIVQIAIGVAIARVTHGLAVHIGTCFINEGMNDIIFAVEALFKGHCRWKDYARHKSLTMLTSVLCSAMAAGVGVLIGKFARTGFASKVVTPEAEMDPTLNQVEVTGLSVFLKEVAKEVSKQVAVSTLKGTASGIGSTLKSGSENDHCLVSTVIRNVVERHPFCGGLVILEEKVGADQAWLLVEELCHRLLAGAPFRLIWAVPATGALADGAIEATNHCISHHHPNIGFASSFLMGAGKEKLEHMAYIRCVIELTTSFLNKIKQGMKEEIELLNREISEKKSSDFDSAEKFKRSTINKLSKIIYDECNLYN